MMGPSAEVKEAELFARWWAPLVSCCQSRVNPKSAERQEYEDLRAQLVRKQEEVRRLQEQCAQLDALRQPAGSTESAQASSSEPEPGGSPAAAAEQEAGKEV